MYFDVGGDVFIDCTFVLSSQLLIPHVRYTLQINIMGRTSIFGPDGILNTVWIFNLYISVSYVDIPNTVLCKSVSVFHISIYLLCFLRSIN